MTKSAGSRTRRQRGQSVVELALLLPILTLLLLGALDLSRAFYYHSTVTNATRTGAAYAVNATGLTGYTNAERINIVKGLIQQEAAPIISISAANISVTPSTMTTGSNGTISVTYSFQLLNPFAQALWGNPVTLTYTSVIRYA